MKYLDSLDSDLKNDIDDYRNTALTLAAWEADLSTVKFLIETYNMKPQEKGAGGRNAFLSAAEGGKIEIMEFLYKFDPNLKNAKDDYGETALTLAAWQADVSTVKFLIETYNMKPQEKEGHCWQHNIRFHFCMSNSQKSVMLNVKKYVINF